ncbi:hypothetical protein [Paenibacillus sp. NAIST15-1]|uniref:hypothetical protein n=1 Tax=Paenibacillus sp. NAIST15-1 TaxID=1605994 RepID=UPI00086F4D0A|nr:hypothetical protein [Paenibacillus sp. NAIST15-1]GAV12438.1 hypothetical protein PBN151_2371 [Paenibacillus sp. NAIST15-1]
MNKFTKVILSTTLITGGIVAGSILGVNAFAADTTPGTSSDPLVTKSYVDQQVKSLIQAELKKGNTGNDTTSKDKDNPKKDQPEGDTTSNTELKVVTVKTGQKLIAKAGTEVIVRNGKAVITSPDENGVPDVTEGTDIKSGQAVATNHLLLFPRDGRGMMPDPQQENGLIVMVRGGYSVVQKAE